MFPHAACVSHARRPRRTAVVEARGKSAPATPFAKAEHKSASPRATAAAISSAALSTGNRNGIRYGFLAVMAVAMYPGQIVTTLTPVARHLDAQALEIRDGPCFRRGIGASPRQPAKSGDAGDADQGAAICREHGVEKRLKCVHQTRAHWCRAPCGIPRRPHRTASACPTDTPALPMTMSVAPEAPGQNRPRRGAMHPRRVHRRCTLRRSREQARQPLLPVRHLAARTIRVSRHDSRNGARALRRYRRSRP